MYLLRQASDRLLRLSESFPVVVVTGARQVGKSTLVERLFGDKAEIVVFDQFQDVGNARSDPDLFLDNHRPPLVLDEIQYAPELVAALKRRVDRNRSPGQYILTGSQQWGVLRSMSESLAGRAVFLELEGFSLAEIARKHAGRPWIASWLEDPEAFVAGKPERLALEPTLYELLWRGSLPEANLLEQDVLPEFHRAYQRTYIERDVRMLAEVADWQLFGRFVRLLSALTAQEINYSQVGRELGIAAPTTRRWIDILVSAFQWFELPAFSGNAIKRVSSKPKGYIMDTGLACSMQAIASPGAVGDHPLWGALFETAAVGEIRRQCSLLAPRPHLYHWRAYTRAEVDLILEYNGRLYPIEVKTGTHPSGHDTRGLRSLRQAYPGLPIAAGMVVAPVERPFALSENDYAVPWDLAPIRD